MIIIDTGAFIAILNQRDRDHQNVKIALESITEPLITTYPVLTETCYFLLARPGKTTPANFLRQVTQGVVKIFNFDQIHLDRMVVLMERYADLPMDFADASLVVLAESLGSGRILTVDRRDFNVYRWNDTHAFENLII
jgi:uncharacterized protein